jgi:hypothetical protein
MKHRDPRGRGEEGRGEEGRDMQRGEARGARGTPQPDTWRSEPQWMRTEREQRGGWDEDRQSYGSRYGSHEESQGRGGYGGMGHGGMSHSGMGREPRSGYGRQSRDAQSYDAQSYGTSSYGTSSGAQPYDTRSQSSGMEPRNVGRQHEYGYEASGWDDDLDFGARRGYEPFRVGTGMGLGPSGPSRYGYGYGSSGGWDLGTHQRETERSLRGLGPQDYKRSDERIRDDIHDRLTDSHHIDARNIIVDVNQGNVTLNGTVSERRMRYVAEDLVEGVTGVANINNQLTVRAETARGSGASSDDILGETKRH